MSLTGEQIKSYREKRGVTALELAFALGVPPNVVDEMENNGPAHRGYLLAALNAVQKISCEMRGQVAERSWVDEVTTGGISGR